MSMVDGVCLLVDATEGPMAQVRPHNATETQETDRDREAQVRPLREVERVRGREGEREEGREGGVCLLADASKVRGPYAHAHPCDHTYTHPHADTHTHIYDHVMKAIFHIHAA